jgi:hypothetical protein
MVSALEKRSPAGRRRGIALLGVAVTLAVSPGAAASTTIGSDLSGSGSATSCPFGDCTVMQSALPGRAITAPTDGIVVVWRIANASSSGPVRFRVIRPTAGGGYLGAGSVQTPGYSCPAICTVRVRLPIKKGDHIAIDGPSGSAAGTRDTPGAKIAIFSPFLADGEERSSNAEGDSFELLLNADIEPDADKDGFGDETQDLCPTDHAVQTPCGAAGISTLSHTVRINLRTRRGKGRARCANVAGDQCRIKLKVQAHVSSSRAGSARKRKVSLGTATGQAAGGKVMTVRFKLSRMGAALLRDAHKLRARVIGSSRNRQGKPTKINKRVILRAAGHKS